MKRNLTALIGLILLTITLTSFGQTKREIKDMFFEAESYFLFEDYADALIIYEDLLELSPENYNYKYRIGQCLLNDPERKQEAVPFLEEAVQQINPKYKEGKFRETKAPYDAFYYLASAYRVNNQLDEAIESYDTFLSGLDPNVYDSTIVKDQLQSCYNAKKLMQKPFYLEKENLGELINSRFPDRTPVVSADGQTIVFNQDAQFQDFIFYAKKTDDGWSAPINMNFQLAIDQDIYPTSISSDGTELYLYYLDNQDGNIYYSTFEDNRWTEAVILNENINTKYWEAHATISHGNDKLYFSSNNELTSMGGLDIYVSERDSLGDWGPPRNLGPTINTRYHDNTPFLTQDDKTLYFSSRGHYNMGGYDIFYTTLFEDGEWSKPINMGYPVNTTDDDLFFAPFGEGYMAYYSLYPEEGGFGSTDIFRVEVFSDEHPRKFRISGILTIPGIPEDLPLEFRVTALKKPGMDTAAQTSTNPLTGEYILDLNQGEYDLVYEGEGFYTRTDSLRLGLLQEESEVQIDPRNMQVSDLTARLEARDTVGEIQLGDSLQIHLAVEENSLLIVEKWKDSVLIGTEQFEIYDTAFVYSYLANEDIDNIQFRLRDRFGNETTTEMPVAIAQPEPEIVIPRPELKRILAQRRLTALLDKLEEQAEGPLKAILRNTDVEELNLTTEEELFTYLNQRAEEDGLPEGSFGELALKTALADNIITPEAVRWLASLAPDPLRKVLLGLNLEEEGISTYDDFRAWLLKQEAETGMDQEEIDAFLAESMRESDPEIGILQERLRKYGIPEEILSLLERNDLDYTRLKDAGDWLAWMIEQTPDTTGQANILQLITSMAANGNPDPALLLERMQAEETSSPLSGFLEQIDLKELDIRNIHQLVDYLLEQSEREGFTKEQVYHLLMRLATKDSLDLEAVKVYWENWSGKPSVRYIWFVAGATLLFLFFVLYRRRKKNKEE